MGRHGSGLGDVGYKLTFRSSVCVPRRPEEDCRGIGVRFSSPLESISPPRGAKLAKLALNPKPLNPKPLNPKALNPKPYKRKPLALNPKPRFCLLPLPRFCYCSVLARE